jgi:hypothetical protein
MSLNDKRSRSKLGARADRGWKRRPEAVVEASVCVCGDGDGRVEVEFEDAGGRAPNLLGRKKEQKSAPSSLGAHPPDAALPTPTGENG